ncbi:CMGC/CDK/CDK8 protein kinase [Flagelloscypha sp. PMI_526]|nr:CMGC/CDK/CDK8 protein kinase [Flagelloscypha sp. PMI_526]
MDEIDRALDRMRSYDPMRTYRARRDANRQSVTSKYKILGFISSGTYGRVYKAQSVDDEKIHAIKKFKPDKEGEVATYTGISQSAIREIALNREISHINIVALKEVLLEDKSIYMVFEYAEHDFLQLIHHHSQTLRQPIPASLLKSLTYQLLNGLIYLHSCHILHRDLKPANILISSAGVVKIGDLGLARIIHEPLHPLFAGDKVVVTIWYRAPELLLCAKHYTKAIDCWAVGCVIAELASLRPIFKGEEAKLDAKKNVPFQRDQLGKIFEVLGTPTEDDWPMLPHLPEYAAFKRLTSTTAPLPPRLQDWCNMRIRNQNGFDLLHNLFLYDPTQRLTARQAILHPWFDEDPIPTKNVFEGVGMGKHLVPPVRRVTKEEMQTGTGGVGGAFASKPGSAASLGSGQQQQGSGSGSGTLREPARKKQRVG